MKKIFAIILSLVLSAAIVFVLPKFLDASSEINNHLNEISLVPQNVTGIKEEKNSELASQVENTDEDAVIEQRAREQGYAYPDERLYYDITPGAN